MLLLSRLLVNNVIGPRLRLCVNSLFLLLDLLQIVGLSKGDSPASVDTWQVANACFHLLAMTGLTDGKFPNTLGTEWSAEHTVT